MKERTLTVGDEALWLVGIGRPAGVRRLLVNKVTIHSLDVLFPNLDPVHCSMSGSNCCFSICIHVSQEAGKMV